MCEIIIQHPYQPRHSGATQDSSSIGHRPWNGAKAHAFPLSTGDPVSLPTEGPFRDPISSSPSSLFVFYLAHLRLRRKFSRSLVLPRSLNSHRSLLSPTSSSSLSQIRCAIPSPSFQLSSTLPFHHVLQQVYSCPGLCRLGQPRLCWSDSRLSPVGHWVSSLCRYGAFWAIIAVAPRLTFRSRS